MTQNGAKSGPGAVPETLPKKSTNNLLKVDQKVPKVDQKAPLNDPKKEFKITKKNSLQVFCFFLLFHENVLFHYRFF